MLLCLRVWVFCWLAVAALPGALAAPPFEDSMAQRVLACTGCHGPQGQAGPDGYYPRLAGKPADYLYRQLRNFREGRRHYPLMSGLLGTLDDAYLHALAAHFASLSLPYPPPLPTSASATERERGRQLVQQGDPARGLPACTQCHGLRLTGVLPATPALLGLPFDYLNAQLGGWRNGQRHADAPDCMAGIARKLGAGETSAIARWLSAQPLPPDTHPAAVKPAATPATQTLQCGSDAVLPLPQPAPTPASANANAGTTPQLERGRYLARIANCASCHSAAGRMDYAGGNPVATPFGAVQPGNLTPDPQHGIGSWSADDFWHALHEGVSKDGHLLYPAFPYTSYTHLNRADSDALFAWLKTLPPSRQPRQPHALRWPYSTQAALRVWRALFFTPSDGATGSASTSADASLQRGAYLVQGAGHCMECHGARNRFGALSGSADAAVEPLPGSLWLAPSLSDPAGASVAGWSAADITLYLQTGRNGRAQSNGPMAEVVLNGTQYLSDADARDMARYLQALSQRATAVPAPAQPALTGPAGQVQPLGARLYETHCADCHGAAGEGRNGAYPALAGKRSVNQALPNNLIHISLEGGFGPVTAGNPRPFGMPPFKLRLTDAELAALLSHIRSSWGNHAAPVSEFDINKFRRASQP